MKIEGEKLPDIDISTFLKKVVKENLQNLV